jgi:Kef-type K+ transport system membrane component KefB
MDQTLINLGLMIISGAFVALVARRLQQPVLLGYVLAGLLIGPTALGLVPDANAVNFLADIGLIFLMFIIGLELDLSKLQDVGKISVVLGTIQVLVTTLVAALLALPLGFTLIQGLYLGLVISFSSTLVVVKTLTDMKEIDSLHGELALGILVIQDVLAVIGLSLLGTLGTGTSEHAGMSFFGLLQSLTGISLPGFVTLIANLALFAAITYLFARYVMQRAFKEAIGSTELLFVVTLAVVFILSAVAGFFEFSVAMGAFLAGIALSTATYSHDIIGRVKPLKDFFLILFFVSLGMQIIFSHFVTQLALILYILVGALVLKPVITFFIMKLFKYNNRTAFMVSAHLAQVGEFGMVLIASGAAAFVTNPVLTGVVIVTIFTMTLTAYVIKYDEEIYQLAKPFIAPLDHLFGTVAEEHRNVPERYQPEVVIIGVNPTTAEAIETLSGKKRVLVIDYNPVKIVSYRERGIPTICTDAMNMDLYEEIDWSKARVVVSVVHEPARNLFVIKKLREVQPDQKRLAVVVTAPTDDWGRKFYRAGATLVLIPDVMGRRMLSELLSSDDLTNIRNIGRVYYEELHKNFVFIREL